jgi:hypothetical protein
VTISKKVSATLALLILAGTAIWFYYTPQLAFRDIRKAVQTRNLGDLERRVDFAALRKNLKVTARARLGEKLAEMGRPLGRMGSVFAETSAAMADSVIERLIDRLVTPDTLAMLLAGYRPEAAPGTAPANAPAPPPPAQTAGGSAPAKEKNDKEVIKGYESFDRYVIAIKRVGQPGEPVAFVLTREALLDWKLSDIRNPF